MTYLATPGDADSPGESRLAVMLEASLVGEGVAFELLETLPTGSSPQFAFAVAEIGVDFRAHNRWPR